MKYRPVIDRTAVSRLIAQATIAGTALLFTASATAATNIMGQHQESLHASLPADTAITASASRDLGPGIYNLELSAADAEILRESWDFRGDRSSRETSQRNDQRRNGRSDDYISARNSATPRTADEKSRESLIHSIKKIYLGGSRPDSVSEDSVNSLIRMFYLEQYRQFHDPEAPTFMFMTADASLALGVGGKLALRGWFDWNGYQSGYDFYPFDISIPADPAHKRGLGGSMSQTGVHLTVLGHHKGLKYSAFIQAAVSGKNFVLKKAYVTLNDFTLGYTSSSFVDDGSLVPTVDGEGPNGQTTDKQILVKYLHKFRKGWSVGGSIAIPHLAMSPIEGKSEGCTGYVPDFAALAQYSWDNGASYVRASGILRTLSYRNLIEQRNHNVTGWGAQLSGCINIITPLTVYFQGAVGRGIGSLQGDLACDNYDLVGDSSAPGAMVAPLSLGLTAGVRYDISSKVFACIGLGEQQYYGRKYQNPTDYRYGLYGCVNAFWRITPRFMAGIEYITAKRKDFSGRHAGANRLDAMVSYSF